MIASDLLERGDFIIDRILDYSDYRSLRKSQIIKSKILAQNPDGEVKDTILNFAGLMEVYPENKIKNPEKYCAIAAQIFCLEHRLSSFASKIFTEALVRKNKNLPAISEINKEVKEFRISIEEFNPWFEEKNYKIAHKNFMDDLNRQGVEFHRSDLKSFQNVFFTWPSVFPYDGFLHTNKFNPVDQEYHDLLSQKLMLPLSQNVMFFLLDTMLKYDQSRQRGKIPSILDISKESAIQKIKKQFPHSIDFGSGFPFLTPYEWLEFDWNDVEYDSNGWRDPFIPFPAFLFRLIANNEICVTVLSKLFDMTRQHFDLQEMFE